MKLKCQLLPCIRAAHTSDSEPDNMNPSQMAGLTDIFGTQKIDQIKWYSTMIISTSIICFKSTTWLIMSVVLTTSSIQILNTVTSWCYTLQRMLMIINGFAIPGSLEFIMLMYSTLGQVWRTDYTPWQMDFLHVQWFEWVPQQDLHYLEAVRFVCMNDAIVFNFMDLADILRSCDLLLAFRFGRCHQGQIAMLPIVHDSEDWNLYYVNRYNMFACSLPLLIVNISDSRIIICCSGITGASVLDIPTCMLQAPQARASHSPWEEIHHSCNLPHALQFQSHPSPGIT